jgi:hypothetical protein
MLVNMKIAFLIFFHFCFSLFASDVEQNEHKSAPINRQIGPPDRYFLAGEHLALMVVRPEFAPAMTDTFGDPDSMRLFGAGKVIPSERVTRW